MAESSLPPPPINSNGLLIGLGLVALLLVGGLVFWRQSSDPTAGKELAADDARTAPLPSVERAGDGPVSPPPPPPPPPRDGIALESEHPPSEATDVAPSVDVTEGAHGGKERSSTGKPAVAPNAATPNTDGCSGTCPNRVDAALNQALRQRGASARNCYNAALRSNPNLQGKVGIKVRISPSGSTCSASITNDSLGDPSVTSCILQKFKGGGYPKPNGGCADFEVPLSFVSNGI